MYDEKVAQRHRDRMAEPDYLRELRNQIDDLDRQDRQREYQLQAEELRREIRWRGHKPRA